MGLWWEEIIPLFPSLQSTGSRFAQMMIDGVLFINDAYNAGPESVRAALDNLPKTAGRRIAVLGGMTVDLGPMSDSIHREVARHALERADLFFCYGPGAMPMKEVFEDAGRLCLHTEDMEVLRKHVFSSVQPQDVVLVKGANRYAMWQLFQGKTQ
jgi:UDP-N-acetylmuramyl pentapeptide synthase